MGSWRSIASTVVLGLVLAGCAARRPDLPSYGLVSDFQLTDQAGATFDAEPALKGRVWVADFMFTNCPGPCPRMSSQMHEVQNALSDQGVKLV